MVSKYLCLGSMLYELGEVINDDMISAAGNGTYSCQVKTTVYSQWKDFSFSPPFMHYGWDHNVADACSLIYAKQSQLKAPKDLCLPYVMA